MPIPDFQSPFDLPARERRERTVGIPEIQRFVGALHGVRARKGVFLTTSTFSVDARVYFRQIEPRVILIDVEALARFMIDHIVGVAPVRSFKVKKIDSEYLLEN